MHIQWYFFIMYGTTLFVPVPLHAKILFFTLRMSEYTDRTGYSYLISMNRC